MDYNSKTNRWINYSVGGIALLLMLLGVSAFPSFQLLIVALVGLVIISCYFVPTAWLLILPSIIVLVDLSSWTGRFVFNEFDWLVFSVIAMGFLRRSNSLSPSMGETRLSVSYKKYSLPLLFLALVVIHFNFTSLVSLLSQPLFANPYYFDAYHVKVGKGIIYGFILAILLTRQFNQNSNTVISHLALGSCFASFGLFTLVLWERGTLFQLFNATNWWALANSFLDFTSSYRVTALVSDMHTGGEAYDGIILTLIPLNLLGFFWFKKHSLRLLAVCALMAVCYCVLVGFTRATYFATAFSIGCFFLLYTLVIVKQQNQDQKQYALIDYLMTAVLIVSSFVLFKSAGYAGLVIYCGVLIAAIAICLLSTRIGINKLIVQFVFALITLLGILLSLQQASESKWITSSTIGNISIIVGIIVTTVLSYRFYIYNQSLLISSKFYHAVGVIISSVLLSAVAGGYQINARVDNISADLSTRFEHWSDVVNSSDNGVLTVLFGNGVGSFPLNYALNYPDKVKDVGGFIVREGSLVLGRGDDLAFGQRVDILPNTEYVINFEGQAEQSAEPNTKGRIGFFLCERNLIFASNFNANCVAHALNIDEEHNSYRFELNSKNVGSKSMAFLRWPTTFYIKNFSKYGNVNIKQVSLKTAEFAGVNYAINSSELLQNTDFNQGVDYWYFYNDFKHLPWHIKNTYLSVVYQLGIIGFILLAFMFCKAMLLEQKNPHLNVLKITFISLLAGMLPFGLFGDPFDSARVSTYFFTLAFATYLLTNAKLRDQLNRKNTKIILGIIAVLITVLLIGIFSVRYYFQQSAISLIKTNVLTNISTVEAGQSVQTSTNNGKFSVLQKALPRYDFWRGQAIGPNDFGEKQHLSEWDSLDKKRLHRVISESEFLKAITKASAGDIIELMPGNYVFSGRAINLTAKGRPDLPIIIRSSVLGEVTLAFNLLEGFKVSGPYWQINNLIINGVCEVDSQCEHAVHVVGEASHFSFENNIVTNFNAAIKANQTESQFPDYGNITSNAFYNLTPRKTANPVTLLDLVAVSNWKISGNFIADFAKGAGDNISYGVFLKGGGESNVIENNLIDCQWRNSGGVNIGASFGGGGTQAKYCRDKQCQSEQSDSLFRNNIVMNCSDVGLYINKSKHITVFNNLFYRTRGIDVRYKESSAIIKNNILDGRINKRDNATVIESNNVSDFLTSLALDSTVETIFSDPEKGDFIVKQARRVELQGEGNNALGIGFCGNAHSKNVPNIGPFETLASTHCHSSIKLLITEL